MAATDLRFRMGDVARTMIDQDPATAYVWPAVPPEAFITLAGEPMGGLYRSRRGFSRERSEIPHPGGQTGPFPGTLYHRFQRREDEQVSGFRRSRPWRRSRKTPMRTSAWFSIHPGAPAPCTCASSAKPPRRFRSENSKSTGEVSSATRRTSPTLSTWGTSPTGVRYVGRDARTPTPGSTSAPAQGPTLSPRYSGKCGRSSRTASGFSEAEGT